MPKRSLRWQGRNVYLSDPDKRGIWRGHLLPGHKGIDVSRSGYGWACERTPAEREKEREFYGIYFNEYHSLKNGKGEELEALPDYLEEKPLFDRKA